jgi:hypothetical protein
MKWRIIRWRMLNPLSRTQIIRLFLKGLSEVAAKEGVTHWEQDSLTYIGIGKGLKKARAEGIAYETYKKNFAQGDDTRMEEIQIGYESED